MISVVVPALNEEDSIAQVVEQLRAVLDQAAPGSQIIVVDDGSSDRTGELARAAGATVIGHPHNVGYGRSLKDGIRAAQHDTVCILDADLTYPVEVIPALLEDYAKGFELVVGARTGHHYHGSVFKGPLRWVLRFLVEFTAGREIPDANSGLRVFSRETMLGYLDHLCDTFSFTTSQTLAYAMTGRFVKFVPIDYNERVGASKVRLVKDAMRTMQYIVQAIIYYDPLKIFILFSLLSIAVSVLSFLAGALTGLTAPYFLGVGGLLLSVIIFSLGLLADLLRQIMVRGRGEGGR